MLRQLAAFPLLAGAHGAPPCNLDAIAGALASFSVMCAVLGEYLSEADVNPLIATRAGVMAVDALFVGKC